MDYKHISYTIEPINGKFWYCEHGQYGEDSVLAGQSFRQLMKCYNLESEAVMAHPEAEVIDFDNKPYTWELPHAAPEWFDEADAGERWDDDY